MGFDKQSVWSVWSWVWLMAALAAPAAWGQSDARTVMSGTVPEQVQKHLDADRPAAALAVVSKAMGDEGGAELGQLWMTCWQAVDAAGLIGPEQPVRSVIDALGPPLVDTTLPDGRRRLIYGPIALDFIDGALFEWVAGDAARDAAPSPWPRVPAIEVNGQTLVAGHRARSADGGVVEFVPDGQTVQNHDTMLVIQRFAGGAKQGTLRQRFEATMRGIARQAPDLRLKVVRESDTELIYYWNVGDHPHRGIEAQHEVARFLVHGDDVLRFAYGRKSHDIDEKAMDRWANFLASSAAVAIATDPTKLSQVQR